MARLANTDKMFQHELTPKLLTSLKLLGMSRWLDTPKCTP